MELPATVTRVSGQTAPGNNEAILEGMEQRVRELAERRERIGERLQELDREWDIERVLETNAAAVAFCGTLLSLKDRRFAAIPLAVTAFLFQHALQGWCPPLPLFRRLGFRTQYEIEQERYALKGLRGDFGGKLAAGEALEAVLH